MGRRVRLDIEPKQIELIRKNGRLTPEETEATLREEGRETGDESTDASPK